LPNNKQQHKHKEFKEFNQEEKQIFKLLLLPMLIKLLLLPQLLHSSYQMISHSLK